MMMVGLALVLGMTILPLAVHAEQPFELEVLQEAHQAKLQGIDSRLEGAREAPLLEKYDAALARLALLVDAEIRRLTKTSGGAPQTLNSFAKPDSAGKLDGERDLIHPETGKLLRVTLTALPPDEDDPQPKGAPFLMEGTSLGGNYSLKGRKLSKVREERDSYWDIVWIRRGAGFINHGSHYNNWRMVRPREATPE